MKHLTLVVLLLLAASTSEQSLQQGSASAPVEIVPFELALNHFYIKGAIDGSSPLSILLDSGSVDVVIDRRRFDDLGLPDLGKALLPGLGGGMGTAGVKSEVEKITLGNVNLERLASYSVPLDFFSELVGHETDAVLGAPLFSRYVVEVDYLGRVVRLYNASTYSDPAEGCQLPLTLEGNEAIVRGGILDSDGSVVETAFLLDTGSSFSILTSAFGDSHPSLLLNQKTIDAPIRKGLSGTIKLRLGRVRAIKLASCVVDEPIVALSEDASGPGSGGAGFQATIGTNIFQQFTTIFDYRRHLVIFERNSSPDGPFEENMAGIHVLAGGPGFHQFVVDQVMPSSPAKRKGIRVGDTIESVDKIQATDLTVSDLEKRFARRGHVHLIVRRGVERLKIRLKLKPLI